MRNKYIEMKDYTIMTINSRNFGTFLIQVDTKDVPRLKEHTWGISQKMKRNFYVQTAIKVGDKQKVVSLHRFLMGFPKGVVHHKNGVPTDNRKSNLEVTTQKSNCRARQGGNINSRSEFLGVSYDGSSRRLKKCWKAQITVSGKVINLGRFETEIEAAQVRDEASINYFGSNACLNFKGEQ